MLVLKYYILRIDDGWFTHNISKPYIDVILKFVSNVDVYIIYVNIDNNWFIIGFINLGWA